MARARRLLPARAWKAPATSLRYCLASRPRWRLLAFARGRDCWRLALLGWPLAALLAIAIAHGGRRTALLPAFLTLVLLWPATLAAGRIAGERAGAAGGLLLAGLFWLQAILPHPVPEVQHSMVEKRLESPAQSVRHVIRLPLGSPSWRSRWAATPPPEAYLYVMLSVAEGTRSPALGVQIEGQPVGELTATTWARGGPQEGAGGSGWHRIRLSREALERDPLLEVTVAPVSPESFTPGAVGFIGGYSLRPTVRPAPSAFFDGERWSTEPQVLLPAWPDGVSGAVRYYVELRLIHPLSRRLIGTYY